MAEVRITNRCREMDVPSLPKDILPTFVHRLEMLVTNPKHGKPLHADLKNYRSLRLGRYRIIHRYDREQNIVWVVAVGIRKEGSKEDIYKRITKLLASADIPRDE
jgi:mRNA-degrading endonuclease RelE of RelBE toxin-antitoxin system